MSQVLIIGAGHNGLAAAFYVARAGLNPVVLEARETVGGGATTAEIHPGFRAPVLAHHAALASDVMRDMELARHGLEILRPPVEAFVPALDGPPLVLHANPDRTREALHALGSSDADAYRAYRDSMTRIARVVAPLLGSIPPAVNDTDVGDLWALLGTGRRFRALGRRDAHRLLRWAPMPVFDLVHEWFASDLLRAAIAGPAVSGTMLGPRSAGSGLVLLLREATALLTGPPLQPRGGPGALTAAMAAAARAAGAQIRTGTRVERILVADDRIAGVVADGRELPATTVLSAVDPKTTFLHLMDPIDLAPGFLTQMRNYRAAGTVAKVNLALSGLPPFGAAPDLLTGRIHLGPGLDVLERAFDAAKYGELPAEPWLEVTVPSILDPHLAPPGAHVMSAYVHYAAHRLRTGAWHDQESTLVQRVLAVLERFAPGVRGLVLAAHVVTPAALEAEYGLFGGHIYHGELALDQMLMMRPLLGFARYRGPIPGLYLCSGGTHPGGFMSGLSGRLAAREVLRDRR